MPAKKFVKYRKVRRKAIPASRMCNVDFGSVGLRVLEPCKLNREVIMAARNVIMRTCKRKCRLIVRASHFLPVTKKPLEVRMGGGKGPIDHEVTCLRPGAVLFELDNVSLELAKVALNKARYKLGARCEVIMRKFIYSVEE